MWIFSFQSQKVSLKFVNFGVKRLQEPRFSCVTDRVFLSFSSLLGRSFSSLLGRRLHQVVHKGYFSPPLCVCTRLASALIQTLPGIKAQLQGPWRRGGGRGGGQNVRCVENCEGRGERTEDKPFSIPLTPSIIYQLSCVLACSGTSPTAAGWR